MKAGSGSFGLGCWCVRSRAEDGRVGDAAPTSDGWDGGSGMALVAGECGSTRASEGLRNRLTTNGYGGPG